MTNGLVAGSLVTMSWLERRNATNEPQSLSLLLFLQVSGLLYFTQHLVQLSSGRVTPR